jgi:hypothetical protein
MKVRLVWIETNFRNEELSRREEILESESQKTPTRHYVSRLIARVHPELRTVDRVFLAESFRDDLRWRVGLVGGTQLGPNRWLQVYADPVEGAVGPGRPIPDE